MEKNWKNQALEIQLKFKKETLKLTTSGTFGKQNKEYENILSDTDAKNGANFYCHNNSEEWQLLKDWAKLDNGKRVDFTGAGLKNMLRSEHIPYNMFFPLEKIRTSEPEALNSFIEKLLDNTIKVDKVSRIKIEFASDLDKSKLLDDNTSFDAYIEYLDGDKKCGLGIELKYTEKSYPYGNTEQKRMWDANSEYNKLSVRSGYYKSNKIEKLRDNTLKQLWRNHLLGIKLVDVNELNQFHSVHIYPEGNIYQKDACDMYIDCLNDEKKQSFVPVTFEKFTSVAKDAFGNQSWIEYLEDRY